MLYSSKKEINTLAEHGELELDERGDQEEEVETKAQSNWVTSPKVPTHPVKREN